jgi:hypothetical protein
MGAYYVQRQFADGLKSGIALTFAEISRSFIFGSKWRQLRIGINFAWDDYNTGQSIFGARFAFGVQSGNVGYLYLNGNGSSTVATNYVGVTPLANNGLWNSNTITYTANSGNPYFSNASERGVYLTKVGNTLTTSAIGSNGIPTIPNTYGSVQRRVPIVLNVTKNVGSTTLKIENQTAAASTNCSTSDFIEIVSSIANVTGAGFGPLTVGPAGTLTSAVESNGPYDTFGLSWGTNNVMMEIYEMVVIRLN